ncbi:PIR protein [Plasmodium ovale]|uniref:PIR protein n=1 Tax=Plasmodium ovale TaxID=36330 RepID=A0A1C3KK61_PLAOA|nr:PIR protein [Plasmodium ovale]
MNVTNFRDNSKLCKLYKQFSNVVIDAHKTYETCIKETTGKHNVNCKADEEIKQSLINNWEQVKGVINESNSCDYLLYWMFGKIEECKSNVHCMIWLYKKFQNFWESNYCCEKNEENKCKKTFVIEFDTKVLKNKRELYEFLEFYNNIENILNHEETKNKDTYCKYVKHMFDLYHSMNDMDKYVHEKYKKELELFQQSFQSPYRILKLKKVCNYPNLSAESQRGKNNAKLPSEATFERFIPGDDYLSKNGDSAPEEMNDILKTTTSYELYKEFNEEVTDKAITEDCEKFFKDKTSYQSESVKICKKIINNFRKIYNNETKIKVDNPCLHYKNWVYEELWKMITKESYNNSAGNIINKFVNLQNEKNFFNKESKNFCHYYFIFKDFTELNAKKEEKDLHDYFKYYHIIDEKISPDMNDKEKYKRYLDYIKTLYIRHKIGWKCCDTSYGVDPLCRHYFKCGEEYNPSDLLEILNGAKKEEIRKRYKSPPVVVFGNQELPEALKGKDVMRIQYGRCTEIYYPDDRGKIFGLRCDYKAQLPHYNNFVSALTDEKKKGNKEIITETEIKSSSTNDSARISNTEEIELSPSHFKIGTSVALGIGTVFIFFLYYRFTPFGSLFGKRGRGRNFEDDFNEEYMQEFPYDSEYEDINMRNRRIQIAYQGA